MSTLTASAAPPTLGRRDRASAAAALTVAFLLTMGATGALASPHLVSRFGLSSDVAASIARAVNALGYVPWWALLIIGGGVAGILVRMVIRYGISYTVAY